MGALEDKLKAMGCTLPPVFKFPSPEPDRLRGGGLDHFRFRTRLPDLTGPGVEAGAARSPGT